MNTFCRISLRWLLVIVLALFASASAQDSSARLPVPDEAARKEALGLMREVFKDDLRSIKREDRQAVARKMLEQSSDSANAPAMRYVLLTESASHASAAGDADTALQAVGQLAAQFDADLTPMRINTLDALAKSVTTAESLMAVTEAYLSAADEGIEREDFRVAAKAANAAEGCAVKARDTGLAAKAKEKIAEVQKAVTAFAALSAARKKLQINPDDPQANLAVGRYECFTRNHWDTGLGMLAKSSDDTLKAQAQQELAKPTNPGDQARLGDGWMEWGDKEKSLAARSQAWERADSWYSRALTQLGGMEKSLLEKKIQTAKARRLKQQVASMKVGSVFGNYLGMKFAYIPAGQFIMGSRSAEPGRNDRETDHPVKITYPYLIGVTEVTQKQWHAVIGNQVSPYMQGDDLPMWISDFDNAMEFCRKLGEKEGLKYRLPTEAEWEYACRAGTQTAYNLGDGEKALAAAGWYLKNSEGKTHPVAKKMPNAFGLYDMHGNAWELCSDWFGDYPKDPVVDPKGPATGDKRVWRGGSYNCGPERCGSALGTPLPSGVNGCRIVLELPE
ncbi:MAG: formylglycine-generating enzyme family protein [Planctomycetes bacterium]|nr:formylglycine-generating enzyme family protein [Planctomycetota bacterium]